MPEGRTIDLYLMNDSPGGAIQATDDSRGIMAFSVPRDQVILRSMCALDAVKKAGSYILTGPNLNDPKKPLGYVGHSSDLSERTVQQYQSKDWWNRLYIVTTNLPPDNNWLNAGHATYLESKMWELAENAGRLTMVGNRPGLPPMGAQDVRRCELFLKNAEIMIWVLRGENLFQPAEEFIPTEIDQPAKSLPTPAPIHLPGLIFYMKTSIANVDNSNAEAYARRLQDGQWKLLKDSLIIKGREQGEYITKERMDMEKEGILEKVSKHLLRLTKDYTFRRSSGAAAAVAARRAPGTVEWHVYEEDKPYSQLKTYGDWTKEQLEPERPSQSHKDRGQGARSPTVPALPSSLENPLFFMQARYAEAYASRVDGKWVVFKDAMVRKEGTLGWDVRIGRENMERDRVLHQIPGNPNSLRLIQDYTFNTPSGAATAVAARNTNGHMAWCVYEEGKPYSQLKKYVAWRKELLESEDQGDAGGLFDDNVSENNAEGAQEDQGAFSQKRNRKPDFQFSMVGIESGAILKFVLDETITAQVFDDYHIKF